MVCELFQLEPLFFVLLAAAIAAESEKKIEPSRTEPTGSGSSFRIACGNLQQSIFRSEAVSEEEPRSGLTASVLRASAAAARKLVQCSPVLHRVLCATAITGAARRRPPPAAAARLVDARRRGLALTDGRQEGGAWIVMFYAPWCTHCKDAKPAFEQASREYAQVHPPLPSPPSPPPRLGRPAGHFHRVRGHGS